MPHVHINGTNTNLESKYALRIYGLGAHRTARRHHTHPHQRRGGRWWRRGRGPRRAPAWAACRPWTPAPPWGGPLPGSSATACRWRTGSRTTGLRGRWREGRGLHIDIFSFRALSRCFFPPKVTYNYITHKCIVRRRETKYCCRYNRKGEDQNDLQFFAWLDSKPIKFATLLIYSQLCDSTLQMLFTTSLGKENSTFSHQELLVSHPRSPRDSPWPAGWEGPGRGPGAQIHGQYDQSLLYTP